MRAALNEIVARSAGSSGLMLFVDGEPLDELLHRLAPGHELAGLVPTLLGCASDSETSVVTQRLLPETGATAIAPVLMCPDDVDLSCSVVVAEAYVTGDFVVWSRLGLDITPWSPAYPASVGEQVNWFHGAGPFRFARSQYLEALSEFDRCRT